MQRAMFDTLDEIERVVAERGHRLRLGAGGTVQVATLARAPARASTTNWTTIASWGFGDDDYRVLVPDRSARR